MRKITFLGAATLAGALLGAPAAAVEIADGAAEEFLASVQETHRADFYRQHEALRADIELVRGNGEKRFAGTMTFDAPLGRARLELDEGTTVVFDGNTAWVTPADSDRMGRARFDVLTWAYFLAAPFKLSDPGVNLRTYKILPMMEGAQTMPTVKMTFDSGVGDAPDDWYVLYQNPETGVLDSMAYIVTFLGPKEEAEKKPHAIHYEGYELVDGVPFSTDWTFYNWSEEKGMYGDPLMRATISSIAFVPYDEDAFTAPEGAVEVGL